MLAVILPVLIVHATTFPPSVDMNCTAGTSDIFKWAKEKQVILVAPAVEAAQ
ncbi:MAG: hypothetical protein K2X77_30255 [Candidatus Obscuribacterales bacterium]|jgi:hypothetical protein|nr:hypothetical protein [Candidatus Obscuribacterales bacterium]